MKGLFTRSFLICVLVLLELAVAMIDKSSMLSLGPNSMYLTQSFGMAQRGVMNVNIQVNPTPNPTANGAALHSSAFSALYPAYNSHTMGGFFLIVVLRDQDTSRWYGSMGSSDVGTVAQLCMSPATWRKQVILDSNGRGNFTYTVPSNPNDATDSQYSLAIMQCRRLTNPSVALDVQVTTEMYNAQPQGDGRSYLSIQDVPKLRILQFELVIMPLFIIILVAQILLSMKPWYVLKMHVVFLVTVMLSLLLVVVTYIQQQELNTSGVESSSLDMTVSVVDHFNSTSILLCFLLLSLGWCTTRIGLSQKEIRAIAGSLGIYFLVGIIAATCDGSTQTCQATSLVAYILKTLLLLGIIIAMNFTVTQLRAGLVHSPWIPSTPVQYARVKQFQTFRVVFILYLLLPTAFLLVQSSFYSWKEDWVMFMLNEVLNLYLFFHVGATFSPMQEPFLIRAFDNTFTAAIRNAAR